MFINSSCHTRLRVVGFTIKSGLLLPLSLLVVVVGCQALDGVHPDGDLPVNLGLLLLLVGDGVGKDVVHICLHPQVAPDAKTDDDQGNTNIRFPFSGWSLNFCKSLAKAGSIQNFLLFLGQLLPVTLLLLSESCNLSNIFLKPMNKKTLEFENYYEPKCT